MQSLIQNIILNISRSADRFNDFYSNISDKKIYAFKVNQPV